MQNESNNLIRAFAYLTVDAGNGACIHDVWSASLCRCQGRCICLQCKNARTESCLRTVDESLLKLHLSTCQCDFKLVPQVQIMADQRLPGPL